MEHIVKELRKLESEIRFERNEVRKAKLEAAKKALEWALDPKRHFEPHDSIQ